MTTTRTLLLLRHASAEATRPGHGDVDRRLSSRGEAEAEGLGTFWREQGLAVDRVLCSPAVRTTQTLERLHLAAPVDIAPLLYQAGSEEVLELVVAADVGCVLVVGHAPAVPGLVYDLADPSTSAPAAAAAVAARFPPATLACLEVDGAWSEPSSTVLRWIRFAIGRGGQHLR